MTSTFLGFSPVSASAYPTKQEESQPTRRIACMRCDCIRGIILRSCCKGNWGEGMETRTSCTTNPMRWMVGVGGGSHPSKIHPHLTSFVSTTLCLLDSTIVSSPTCPESHASTYDTRSHLCVIYLQLAPFSFFFSGF